MAEPAATHIGRYEIRRRIGRGGMATVYAAFDPLLGREVAIKVLSAAMTPDAVVRERFVREASVNLRLQHQAILPIYSLDESDDAVYIVMALAPGGSLDSRLRGGPLAPAEVIRIIGAVAGGLDHAHGRGVVHRDLKPGNILFDANDQPLIADFGIARFQSDAATHLTLDHATIGTPVYLSPEQARGETVAGQTDIYALAIMTFEMLTGAPPFTGDTPVQVMYRHLTDPLPERGLPEPVQRVLVAGTAKQATDRYTTAGAFAKALEEAITAGAPAWPLPRAEAAPPSPATATGTTTQELPAVQAPPAPEGGTMTLPLPGAPQPEPALPASRARSPLVPLIAISAIVVLASWLTLTLGSSAAIVLGGAAAVAAVAGGVAWWRRRGERAPDAAAGPGPHDVSIDAGRNAADPPHTVERVSAPVRAHALAPGQHLAEYRIVERLDDGDRTRVYRAFDERRGRDVAVRVIPIDDDAPERVQRLEREAALLGRLHHAHIVPYFDFGTMGGASYLVMPLLGGRSLGTRIREQRRLAVTAAVDLTGQIAGALHYLHGEGIVSRDLKPSGLVFDRHDNLYLADLRVAKDLAEPEDVRLTMVGQPLGTPTYMSPEQFLGDRITPAADQYVLACLVFEMLTGARPFEADSPFSLMLKHVREDPPAVRSLRDDVPAGVDDVLATALAKDPARRFADVIAFHHALAEACDTSDGRAPPVTRSGHVFISYSREDGDFAHRLADELRRRGMDVWIDARIEPSDQWWRVIVDAIDSCTAFVAVMSPSANGSKWVEREVLLADQRGKPPFPVLLSGQAFPIYVGTQYVDVRGAELPPETFFDRLARVAGRTGN